VKTALRACSITMRELLRQALAADPELDAFFDPVQGGTMVVSLDTPQELVGLQREGVSLWLYRVRRDDQTLNLPPRRVLADRLMPPPLPLRLHYLAVPIVNHETRPQAPELEQHILGKALQVFNDVNTLRGSRLLDDLAGRDLEIFIRLEPMTLEEITRVWDALELSYQLSVSYEVSVVPIESGLAVDEVHPVEVSLPEYGITDVRP
jgi:uncharacterized protein DUF4255